MTRPAIMITGAAKRIGAAMAKAFGEAGWHVVIHYGRSSAEAEALAATLASAQVVQCDLADAAAATAMIEDLSAQLSDWRVLINSAAVFEYDSVTSMNPETYSRAMQVNAASPARMAQAFFRLARSEGGRRVIQFTDMKLANTNPDFFSYTMSKHAAASSIGMIAKSHGDPRDRIYGLAPGAILASHDQSEAETELSHVLNLLQRKTGANEIAEAAMFLAEGHIASGETLFIDSGQHLLNQPRDVIYLARETAGL